jgi:hypothetical protein
MDRLKYKLVSSDMFFATRTLCVYLPNYLLIKVAREGLELEWLYS